MLSKIGCGFESKAEKVVGWWSSIMILIVRAITVTTPALIGICLGSTFFLISLAAVTCFCYRRRSSGSASQKLTSVLKKSHHPDKPLVLRKPTAVKSPSSGSVGGPVLMKKSPSPTQSKISPPGGSSRTSPTGNGHRSPSSKDEKCAIGMHSSNHSSRQSSPNVEDKNYIESENEKLKNSSRKEDMEDNKEKEVLVEKSCKLGQLYFRNPKTMARRKGLSHDEIVNLLRELSENEPDAGEISCSNLDSDEDIRSRENDCEESEESAD
ncbi:UNVERIFIED_CONTAM: hypothetical protein NCL1_18518 [Trichonephila clavipes]